MPRIDSVRAELQRLIRAVPFRRFQINLKSGDRASIEHPENVAFDPEPNGSEDFYVISGKVRLFSTFSAVSGIVIADREGNFA